MKKTLLHLAALLAFCGCVHAHARLMISPSGGRLLALDSVTTPNAEFTVTADRRFQIVFLDKDRKPIQPITGDYNMKACLFDDCQWVSVGNITGPDDFYMRWQYGDDQKYNGGKGLAIMTYEFGGIDHEDQERCVVEEWTDYPGELTRWVHDCQAKENTAFANRTRVCSL